MAKISLKKDYMDGNILYGKDLNPNFETIETTINANDDTQAETNAEVEEALTQLNSNMTQAQTDIGELQEDVTNLESGITSGDSTTLESAKSYTDTKLQDYAKTTDVPTKISQLENDDNTVKDATYVHTDNNFSDTDKTKLDSLNNYELPIASANVLGGVKVGEGLDISSLGDLNILPASSLQLGGVKAGKGATITADGTLNIEVGDITGKGIPTLVGTQEDPIRLYDYFKDITQDINNVPMGFAYISGYTKQTRESEVSDEFDGLLLYTGGFGQVIGPYYEEFSSNWESLNLVFWFRPTLVAVTGGYYTRSFVKYEAHNDITDTERGYVTPKAVYDYVGALTSLNTTDKTSIVNAINEVMNSAGTPGEDGATFTPSVDDSGTLSWTNDKGLVNPDPVNIKGPKGDTGEQGEQGEQGLPGATGPGVPTGGIIGQVLSKIGDGDYETGWKDIECGSSTGFKVLNPTAEEPIDLAAIQENGFYYCKCSSSEQFDAYLNKFSTGSYNGDFITLILGDTVSYKLRLEITALSYVSCRIYVGHNAPDNQRHYASMISDIRPSENMNLSNNISCASVTSIKKLADAIGRSSESVQKLVPLSDLQTTDKSSLVAAINELKARIDALENPTE